MASKGGVAAWTTAGAIAVSGAGHYAAEGHVLPTFLRDAKPAAEHRHYEIPDPAKDATGEALKHCTREWAAGRSCDPRE
jgi:hypothetical protein